MFCLDSGVLIPYNKTNHLTRVNDIVLAGTMGVRGENARGLRMKHKVREFFGKNIDLLQCIGICLITSFLTFIYFIIKGEGVFVTTADFNLQNIPFTTAMHRAVAEGGFDSFSWNLDLGSSTIQGYSFYNLGSPFFWLSMLFPAEAYPFVVGWMYMLKYTVAGCLAFFYFKRFVRNPKLAIVGGVLYAFSGFSATNMMYHFHDAIAFFPLMLIGIERYMEDRRKKGGFIVGVALNALINYFFFVQSVVFLIIYFIVRFWKKGWKENFKNIGGCLVCGILGVGMAAPLFLPGVMHILLGNNQNGSCIYINNLLPTSSFFLFTLKAMFFPAELQNSCSVLESANYSSTACYLPMVGITFVIAYVRKHKDWLSRILLILVIMSLSPLLSGTFLLFTGWYHRWWGALVMMMALATVLVLDKAEEYKIVTSAIINGVLIVGMWAIIQFMPVAEGFPALVYREKLFIAYTLIALAGVVLCIIGAVRFKVSHRYMICCVCVFAIMTTGLAIYEYQDGSESGSEYLEKFMAGVDLQVNDEQYRYISEDNMWVFPGEATGLGGFSSTRSNAIKHFDSYFDATTDIYSMNKTAIGGLAALLGGKYYVTGTVEDRPALQEFEINGIPYYVYETDACPIGFAVSSFISEEELSKISVEKRGVALLSAALVSNDDIDLVSDTLNEATADSVDFERSVADYVEENTANAVHNFDRDANGFTCTTDYDEERYVYFSVPFDNDWTLYMDGEKSDILSSGGMMLVRVPAGEHALEFRYSTPFYRTGVVMSLISCVILVAYECILYRRKSSQSI